MVPQQITKRRKLPVPQNGTAANYKTSQASGATKWYRIELQIVACFRCHKMVPQQITKRRKLPVPQNGTAANYKTSQASGATKWYRSKQNIISFLSLRTVQLQLTEYCKPSGYFV